MSRAYTVSLDRRSTVASSDDMGFAHAQEASIDGFPIEVKCDWQPRNGRAVKTPQGIEATLDVMMLCNDFHDGRDGDVVTDPNDSTILYRVFSVNRHSPLGSNRIDHSAYWLTRAVKVSQ